MLNAVIAYFKALFSFSNQPLQSTSLWTEMEINTAISMSVSGCSIKDIALKLNRTESAVYQKLLKLKTN